MARTVTLLELRTQARQRADMENTQYVSDAEVNSYINSSIAELYDLLVQAFEDYYISSATITLVAGTDVYTLPNDFYKVLGVDLDTSTNFQNSITLRAYNFAERNRNSFYGQVQSAQITDLQYHIQGPSIRFIPNPVQAGFVNLWYVPAATKLVADIDTFDGVNGYEEFIVWDVAMKLKTKEESDVSIEMMEKQRIIKRIQEAASQRDIGEPWRVTDVYGINDRDLWD